MVALNVEVGEDTASGVWLVSTGDVPLLWPKVEEVILEKGRGERLLDLYDPYHIMHLLRMREMDLWLGLTDGEVDLVLLMQMANFPKKSIYQTVWCGGRNLRKFMPFTKVEQYAVLQGALEVEIIGRSGWSRLFPEYDFRSLTVVKNVARRWGN